MKYGSFSKTLTRISLFLVAWFIFAAMFRSIAAATILLVFVMQTFSGQFLALDYYFNTGAFAKNCINKAKPKMHCNGKCQLMKKMQQEEKQEQQNTERKWSHQDEVFPSSSYALFAHPYGIYIPRIYAAIHDASPIAMAFSVFHPPQLS